MSKDVLNIFEIINKADNEQSIKSLYKLTSAMSKSLEDAKDYTVVFGYSLKAGMISTKVTCYAIGFSKENPRLAIVPISYDSDEIDDFILLNKADISSIAISIKGEKVIKSNKLKEDIRFVVPSYTRADAEEIYQLPIVQTEAVKDFEKWIRDNF